MGSKANEQAYSKNITGNINIIYCRILYGVLKEINIRSYNHTYICCNAYTLVTHLSLCICEYIS